MFSSNLGEQKLPLVGPIKGYICNKGTKPHNINILTAFKIKALDVILVMNKVLFNSSLFMNKMQMRLKVNHSPSGVAHIRGNHKSEAPHFQYLEGTDKFLEN